MPQQQLKIPEEKRAPEYLANERTFLAWIRTSISLMGLGFVVAKFGVWLRELTDLKAPQLHGHHDASSLPIGIGMMAFGAVVAVLALWRYHAVNAAIDRGSVRSDRWLVFLMAVLVVLLAAVMIVTVFLTAESL